ncbi:autophagy protein Apg5 [Ostertagia ostertagi]
MAGEFDYEVSRKIWEAAVPIEFLVERDDDSGDACRPCYAMLPRCSYFSLHLTRSLKEANYLKRRKDQVVSTMKIDEHKQLWSGLVHDRFDEFWSINRRLMECTEERPFHDIPIRLYITGQPFRQVPQPPHDENGEPRTLSHALASLSSDLVEDGKYRFISHGITLPLETPLTYLGKNFAYPDNFVHICAVSDNST